jgi:putative oxidoreductase
MFKKFGCPEICGKLCGALSGVPELITRLFLGWIFFRSGWGKLTHLSGVSEFFASLGIPAPYFNAMLVGGVEFLGGIALILGICTRCASIPLIVIMAVATWTAKAEDITNFTTFFSASEVLYGVLLFWLAVYGSGKYGLDRLCKDRFCKTS